MAESYESLARRIEALEEQMAVYQKLDARVRQMEHARHVENTSAGQERMRQAEAGAVPTKSKG